MLDYKGYSGHVVYDADARLFRGEVMGLNGAVTFQGTSVDEIEVAFKESVDDYIDWCKERGKKPENTTTGELHLTVPPDLYAKIAIIAYQQGMSVNTYVINKLNSSHKDVSLLQFANKMF